MRSKFLMRSSSREQTSTADVADHVPGGDVPRVVRLQRDDALIGALLKLFLVVESLLRVLRLPKAQLKLERNGTENPNQFNSIQIEHKNGN